MEKMLGIDPRNVLADFSGKRVRKSWEGVILIH